MLESLPRLTQWSPELWREATVFNAQFELFAVVGAPLDLSAIALPAILAFMLRHDRPAFYFAVAAALIYAASLAAWFLLVAPANSELATWMPGPIPQNFDTIRMRWETGHMAVATIKLVGFVMVALTLVSIRRRD